MVKLVIIGEKQDQSQQFEYILDNISTTSIHYLNIEMDLNDQIKKVQQSDSTSNKKNFPKWFIVFEIKKSNRQFQEKMIQKLQSRQITLNNHILILLTRDKQDEQEANEIQKKISYKFFKSQIENLVQFFRQNFNYDQEIDINDKQVVMFISKVQGVKNKIFQTFNSPIILQNKWVLVNTPQFNFNAEISSREEAIEQFQGLFKRYSKRLSHFFLIVDQERTDTTKKSFNDLFLHLRKFKRKIIVLLYNRLNEKLESDQNLEKHFLNVAKIKNFYILENNQLEDQEKLVDYFTSILTKEQQDDQLGIDLSETIFQIPDENQEKQDEQQRKELNQNFQLSILEQLQKSISLLQQQKQKYQDCVRNLENQIFEQQHQVSELKKSLNIQQPNKKQQIYDQQEKQFQLQQQETNYRQDSYTKPISNWETQEIYVEKKNQNDQYKTKISKLEKEKEDLSEKLRGNLISFDIKQNSNLNNPSRYHEQLEKQNEQYLIRIDEIEDEIKKYQEQDQNNTNDNFSLSNTNAVQNQQFQPQIPYQSNNYQDQQQFAYQYQQLGSPYYSYPYGV